MSTGDVATGAPERRPAGRVAATQVAAGQAAAAPGVDWINVVSAFGADPAGSGDSTLAINSALAQALPGQPVYLPRGTYKTTAPIEIPPGGVLLGDFANEVTEYSVGAWGSILQPASTWAPAGRPASAVVAVLGRSDGGYAQDAFEQKIYGIFVDGQHLPRGTGADGVQLRGAVSRAHLERVLVARVPGNGVNYARDAAGHGPGAVRMTRVNVRYPGGYGFRHHRVSDCTYSDCLVENGQSDGYSIVNASNSVFMACRSEHNAGNGYTYTCTNSATGSGGTRFVGCSSDRNEKHGIEITSTNASGVPLILSGCAFRRDGRNKGAGGGGYAGIYVTAYPGTVQIAGTSVWPGVGDGGGGANSPETGLLLRRNDGGRTFIIAAASYFQGSAAGVTDDRTRALASFASCLSATGPTSRPRVTTPP